jgi:hypothetical protein
MLAQALQFIMAAAAAQLANAAFGGPRVLALDALFHTVFVILARRGTIFLASRGRDGCVGDAGQSGQRQRQRQGGGGGGGPWSRGHGTVSVDHGGAPNRFP